MRRGEASPLCTVAHISAAWQGDRGYSLEWAGDQLRPGGDDAGVRFERPAGIGFDLNLSIGRGAIRPVGIGWLGHAQRRRKLALRSVVPHSLRLCHTYMITWLIHNAIPTVRRKVYTGIAPPIDSRIRHAIM
jgi:hypothetical protein